MKILIVAATPFEIEPLMRHLQADFERPSGAGDIFRKENHETLVLVTGVGMPMTAYCLGNVLTAHRFDLALNLGIAGCLPGTFGVGEVVQVAADRFGDLGVEERDGSFADVYDIQLANPDLPPLQGGWLINPGASELSFLPLARGITVNRVHGCAASIASLQLKYPDAQVETMESAAFFLACLLHGVRFMALRSISNLIEPRDRSRWNLPLAIANLNRIAIEVVGILTGAG
jgi:futalosine hydrolase